MSAEKSRLLWIRVGAAYLLLLVFSIAAGTGIAWIATHFGRVDRAVIGPLLPPLAISMSFALIIFGVAAVHRRRLFSWFDSFIPPEEKGHRAIVLIVAAASGYEIVRIFLFMFLDYWPTDLPSYHYAGLALAREMNPYDATVLTDLAGKRVFPYVYPPLVAILWMPLSEFPIEIVFSLWQTLSLSALIASMMLCVRLTEPRTTVARTAVSIGVFIVPLGYPFYMAAHHGSISVLFTFLILLFFERLSRGKDVSAGAVLALLCGIKALPALLLLYLLLKRRFLAIVSTLVAGTMLLGASVLVAGFDVHWEFVTEVVPEIGYSLHSGLGFDPTFHPENQSINGFMSRVVFAGQAGVSAVVVAVCLVFAAPVAWIVAKKREIGAEEASAVIIALLLVSPITWFHHLVLLLLPAVVLASRITDGFWRPRWWPLVALAFAAILAHDLGRPVMPVKLFVLWSHIRFFMLVFLYAVSWSALRASKQTD